MIGRVFFYNIIHRLLIERHLENRIYKEIAIFTSHKIDKNK